MDKGRETTTLKEGTIRFDEAARLEDSSAWQMSGTLGLSGSLARLHPARGTIYRKLGAEWTRTLAEKSSNCKMVDKAMACENLGAY